MAEIKTGNSVVLMVIWMTAHADNLGVVLCQDEITELYMAYIGVADGMDETADMIKIAENGAKINFAQAKAFFPLFLNDKDPSSYKY